MLCASCLAEDAMKELRDIRKSAEDAIAEIGEVPTPAPTVAPTPSPTPDETVYTMLQSGDKGDEVARLQAKLIALGCLDGSADGVYGSKTAEAVRTFQKRYGLVDTGVADAATQRALYAADAGARRAYEPLKYVALQPGEAQYDGRPVTFTGTVMQVLTDDTYADTAGVYTVLRVATRGACYDVVYVTAFRPADAPAITEGSAATVWGVTRGRVYYVSASEKYAELPHIEADDIVIG